jgi:ABC-type lipoprotein export system ATPase subunit
LNADGQTIVMVTHDPGVASIATRVVRMTDGRVLGDGSSIAAPPAPLGAP